MLQYAASLSFEIDISVCYFYIWILYLFEKKLSHCKIRYLSLANFIKFCGKRFKSGFSKWLDCRVLVSEEEYLEWELVQKLWNLWYDRICAYCSTHYFFLFLPLPHLLLCNIIPPCLLFLVWRKWLLSLICHLLSSSFPLI
jgi:hypothetical protein